MATTGVQTPNSPYVKISQLPAATLPLQGTELIPMDQNGTVVAALSTIGGFFSPAVAVLTPIDQHVALPLSRRVIAQSGLGINDNGAGSTFAIGITNSIAAAGPIGAANTVPIITYDARGNLTAVSTATITPSAIGAVSSTTQINTGTGLSGGGDLSTSRTLFISPTITAAGPVGGAATALTITYNSQGQLTAVTPVAITAGGIGALRAASNLADVASTVLSRQNLGVDYGPGLQAGASGQIRPFILVTLKTATFSVVDADRGTFFRSQSSASYTAALPAIATLSSGWYDLFRNEGSGVLTVTAANAGVTVGGTPSMAMQPGDAAEVVFDGTNFQVFWPAPFRNSQVFNAGGSFVPPAGVWRVMVEAWGPGGGGGGGSGGSQGAPGGSGSYGRDYVAVTPGTAVVVVVPAGGTGGTAGNPGATGGAVTFGGTTFANGGVGGTASSGSSTAGGAAAAVLEATAGTSGNAASLVGSAMPGANAPKGGGGGTGTAGTGGNGVAPGGGGGGGSGAAAGGNGGAGRVVVWF